MRNSRIGPVVLLALASAWLTAGAAVAQTTTPPDNAAAADADAAKAKAVKPAKKTAPMAVVVITNSRAVALTELDASPTEGAAAAGGGAAKQIVANLAPGKKATAKVAYRNSCLFDLHGAYADGSSTDYASVDLCKDKKINLVD